MELRATKELRSSLKTPASCSQIKKKRKKATEKNRTEKEKSLWKEIMAFQLSKACFSHCRPAFYLSTFCIFILKKLKGDPEVWMVWKEELLLSSSFVSF
jgi:hypothetical protein